MATNIVLIEVLKRPNGKYITEIRGIPIIYSCKILKKTLCNYFGGIRGKIDIDDDKEYIILEGDRAQRTKDFIYKVGLVKQNEIYIRTVT